MLTAGYTIRELRAGDATELAHAYRRNREHLAPWDPLRDDSFYTVDGQSAAVAGQLTAVRAGQLAAWVLEYDGRLVGRINLSNIVLGALCSGSLGYWVDQEHLGKGLAGAAVEHACAGAVERGLHRVDASTLLHNHASQRVLLRCGFERYGTARKYLFIAGSWQDHHLYQRILHDDPP